MKVVKRFASLTAALLVASMILSACGGTAATAVPNTPVPVANTPMVAMTPTAAMMEPTKAMAGETPTTAMAATPMMTSTMMTGETPTAAAAAPTMALTQTVVPVVIGEAGSKGVIKIGVDLPTSGTDASSGIPTRNGVQLAIEEANAAGEVIPGYKLQMYALDDAINGVHNPQQGAANAQSFISDDAVVAVVGPFNSNVARAMMPILNEANLANISPSNTNETLTKPEFNQTQTYRPTGTVTYFRVCTTDDIQGPAGADYAYDKLGFKTVYILDDQEAYGKGIADNFEKEFTKKGGTIIGRTSVPKNTTDFKTLQGNIAAKNPDFVFYGGTTSNGIGLFRKQMKDNIPGKPLFGGDGIVEDAYPQQAGDNADNSYGTVAAVNAETLPEAKAFLDAYQKKFGESVGAYSANSYDATKIIIAAIKANAANWKEGDTAANRETVRAALAATKDFKGVIGNTSFDQNGDTTNKIISIYQVKGGKWSFLDQIRFGQ